MGRLNTPVVLCKDKHHRVDDWLAAAEHIALRGNHHIILGEAGTLSFEPEHAYRLDVDAIVRVRQTCHLPVIANSRGCGTTICRNISYIGWRRLPVLMGLSVPGWIDISVFN